MKAGRGFAVILAGALLLAGCEDTAQENKEAYKTIGIRCMETGEYEEAVDAFDRALGQANGKVTMDEVDICYYKARALFEGGDPEGAIAVYDSLLDLDRGLTDAYFLRGTVELTLDRKEEALADFEEAIRRKGKDIELYIAIYDNLMAAGMETEAVGFLGEATEISGNKPSDFTLRGRAYMILKNYDAALQELDRAIDGGDTDALLYKGQLLTETGNAEAAKSCYTEYLESHEKDSDALNHLGCLAMENGQYEDALNYFDEALEYAEESMISPKEILRNRILVLEYLNRFEEARDALAEYETSYEPDETLLREEIFLETR